jgi:PIN domain nuclease of toxin-antitoxin system
MAGETDRIGTRARAAIGAQGARVLVSAVTVWEVAVKRRLGKLDAPGDFLAQLELAALELVPITARHADRAGSLPLHHRDPFDRLLIAQSAVEGIALVSDDSEMRRYEVEVMW